MGSAGVRSGSSRGECSQRSDPAQTDERAAPSIQLVLMEQLTEPAHRRRTDSEELELDRNWLGVRRWAGQLRVSLSVLGRLYRLYGFLTFIPHCAQVTRAVGHTIGNSNTWRVRGCARSLEAEKIKLKSRERVSEN